MALRSPLNRGIRDRLKNVRKSKAMTVAELARLAGITAGAIHLIESGKSIPGVDTVERIARALGVDPRWFAFGYGDEFPMFQQVIAPGFAPVKLVEELTEVLRGRCGKIDDTYKYLDPNGSAAWCALLRQPEFIQLAKSVPIQELAEQLKPLVEEQSVDILGLGAGTAIHEMNLLHALVPCVRDLRLLLFDVSQPLMAEASSNVRAHLARSRCVPVIGILGNFHQLPSIAHQFDLQGPRRRIVTMFGNTFGNLENELRFVRDSLSWSSPGDILVLDVMATLAPANDPAAIKRCDPALTTRRTPEWFALQVDFLTGPMRRNTVGIDRIEVQPMLDLHSCAIPGSYAIEMQAQAFAAGQQTKTFSVGYFKRYDVEGLKAGLRPDGWEYLTHLEYGVGVKMICIAFRRSATVKTPSRRKAK